MPTEQSGEDLFCAGLPTDPRPEIGKILVTGATGYIGGRLVPELLARGYRVRVMVRSASGEHRERWPDAEVVAADALHPDSLGAALEGIHAAYYLIHSMLLGPKQFESADVLSATNFRKAAEEEGVRRIIYLGSLGDIRGPLSPHLRSRIKVAEELQRGAVPTTVLRAAMIIGSGSASYEIAKHLVQNLPVLPVPRWARTRCQPIAVRDVVKYLVGSLERDGTSGESFDIGGTDILSYEILLKTLARLLGKRRFFPRCPIPCVPFYAYLASLVTPVPVSLTRCLMEGCKNEVVCLNDDIRRLIPFQPITCEEALLRAMSREERDRVHTRWSDAYPPAHELAIKLREVEEEIDYTTSYSLLTEKSASSLYRSICRIGGKEGWFHGNWLWRLRGMLDRILMGVGTSRGRRSFSSLRINDVIDFWRVEDLEEDQRLLLRAEMKLPGRAWLGFRIDKEGDRNRVSVMALYQPRGLLGKAYWYACLPLHRFIFDHLIQGIEKRS